MTEWISTDNHRNGKIYHTDRDCRDFPENPKEIVEVKPWMHECGHCRDEPLAEQLEKIGKGYNER